MEDLTSKLYFIVPNVSLAEQIVGDLKQWGALDDDIGVIGRSDLLSEHLPDADVTRTSHIKPVLRQGAVVDGATGLLAGLAAATVPGGFAIGGAALLGMALGDSAFGAWASSLIGISVPNREVEEFQNAIDRGKLLMIVNTENVGRDRTRAIVSGRHPGVACGGEEGDVKLVA